MILEILIGIILGGAIGYYFKPFHINSRLDNENTSLKYEVGAKNQTIGGLETNLYGKQEELEALKQEKEILAKQLGEEIDRNKSVLSSKKSSEVRTGQIAEQLAPFFMDGIDAKQLRFLGNPIDYIAFQEDKVVFIEVKSGGSKLSHNQKRVKRLIQEKKVVWKEFRLAGKK